MYKYERISIIGAGSYGQVAKARHRQSGQTVAIKRFIETEEDINIRRLALREISLLKHLRHPNIVNMLEVFRRNRHFFLVFEYMDHTLLDEIEDSNKGLPFQVAREYSYQILKGLEYCHSKNVIHRDLKPENVLINQLKIVKICDFGFARIFSEDNKEMMSIYVATRWYRAPELILGDVYYGKGVDIWSFGCVLAEMLSGEPLFAGDTDIDQLHLIISLLGNLPKRQQELILNSSSLSSLLDDNFEKPIGLTKMFKLWPEKIRDIAILALCLDPNLRPDCTKLLKHKLFHFDSFGDKFDEELEERLKLQIKSNPLVTFYNDMIRESRNIREKLLVNLPKIQTPPIVKKRLRMEIDSEDTFKWHIHGPKVPYPDLHGKPELCTQLCIEKNLSSNSEMSAAGDLTLSIRTDKSGSSKVTKKICKHMKGDGEPAGLPLPCQHRIPNFDNHFMDHLDLEENKDESYPDSFIISMFQNSLSKISKGIQCEFIQTAAPPLEPEWIKKAAKELGQDKFGKLPKNCTLICKPENGSKLKIEKHGLHKKNRENMEQISMCNNYREPITLTCCYEKPLVVI